MGKFLLNVFYIMLLRGEGNIFIKWMVRIIIVWAVLAYMGFHSSSQNDGHENNSTATAQTDSSTDSDDSNTSANDSADQGTHIIDPIVTKADCKPYETTDGRQTGIACKQKDGTWRIQSSK